MKKLLILGGNSDIGIQLLGNVINYGNFKIHLHYNKKLPKKSSEKTKLIYTMANKMQILRLILHKKKLEKYRPDAEGKWVWIPEEEYDGRKYK